MTDRKRENPIEERLLDEGETGQRAIVDAAAAGFERDQEDPDSPTRRKRSSGVYDPAHSRGSTAAGPGRGGDERS